MSEVVVLREQISGPMRRNRTKKKVNAPLGTVLEVLSAGEGGSLAEDVVLVGGGAVGIRSLDRDANGGGGEDLAFLEVGHLETSDRWVSSSIRESRGRFKDELEEATEVGGSFELFVP